MLKRENLSDKLADIYRKKILHGELKSGDMIMETQIAKEWGVSRSPVRDALHLLEKAKLVEKGKRGSYKVLELTADYIDNFYDTFNMIYQYSFARAAQRMTPEHLANLISLADKIDRSVEKEDYDAYIEYGTLFGQTILRVADNPIIEQLGLEMMPTAQRIVFAAIEIAPSHTKETCGHIRKSCNHLEAQNSIEAAESFKKFANASRQALIHYIEVEGQTV